MTLKAHGYSEANTYKIGGNMEMFEENENLVLDNTENVEEQTTEEIVDGADTTAENNAENAENNAEQPAKVYTEEELNARVDELLAKKIARIKKKTRNELEKEYQPYKELGNVVNTGLGVADVTEATNNLREFYTKKGITIPNNQPSYNENDLKVLARSEAEDIIDSGYEDVVEEVDRLANIGVDNMTPREKLVFTQLAEYRKAEGSRKELLSIGVKEDVINSQEFKDFAKDFNPNASIKKVYELYAKTHNTSQVEQIGSMKNPNAKEEKTFYTSDEVDKLTEKDLDDPIIFERVRQSMAKW